MATSFNGEPYQTLTLPTSGGHHISARLFSPSPRLSEEPPNTPKLVILAGAIGVAQVHYAAFAQWLAKQGFAVITFDYAGIGLSLQGPVKECKSSIRDWAEQDCTAVLHFARKQLPESECIWIGHSVGGQVLGMIPDFKAQGIDRIITMASGTGYWLHNAWPTRRVSWLLWYVLVPLTVPFLGYFPGDRLKILCNLPGPVMKQWRKWCFKREYAVAVEGPEVREQFAAITTPITAISFTDDEMMSRTSIDTLHSFFTSAPQQKRYIKPAELGEKRIGHLGWYRKRFQNSVWKELVLPILQEPDNH